MALGAGRRQLCQAQSAELPGARRARVLAPGTGPTTPRWQGRCSERRCHSPGPAHRPCLSLPVPPDSSDAAWGETAASSSPTRPSPLGDTPHSRLSWSHGRAWSLNSQQLSAALVGMERGRARLPPRQCTLSPRKHRSRQGLEPAQGRDDSEVCPVPAAEPRLWGSLPLLPPFRTSRGGLCRSQLQKWAPES